MSCPAARSIPSVPVPVTLDTVTVYCDPLPVTDSTGFAIAVPVVVSSKSPAETPVTSSLNVTVNASVSALVSSAAGVERSIASRLGAVVSARPETKL